MSLRSHVRYAHADRVFSCPRSFTSDQLCKENMARKSSGIEEILPSEIEERDLLDENEEDDESKHGEAMPKVLRDLSKVLTNMSSSMLSIMEQSIKRMNCGEMSDSEEPAVKKRKRRDEQEDEAESDASDGEHLLNTTEPPADSATEGEASVECARLEHDALLSEISQDFDKEEDLGPNINQQLADIINKRWSTKLNEVKIKEKMEKYFQPANCDKLIVPCVNAEIWDKLDNKTKHHDLRSASIQKSMAKVGAILALSTETLVQMRQKKLPEVDKLVKLNTDALALLGHTSCELSMRRRDAIKPNLHKDYSSLCAPHVPVTSFLFGDNLQTRLNDIRASNKISKTTVPERFKNQAKGRSRFSTSWSNNNSGTDNRQRRGNPFLSKGRHWKQQSKKDSQPRNAQWQ